MLMQSQAALILNCRTAYPDLFFQSQYSRATRTAKELCSDCPVAQLCQSVARTEGIPFGVWGGEDEWERREYWKDNGGRPSLFVDAIRDALIRPEVVPDEDAELTGYQKRMAERTECASGHTYTEESVYRAPSEPNTRHCRTCKAARDRKRWGPK